MELLYFILGFIFAQFLIPVIDGLASWLLTWMEAKKVKQSETINCSNIKMRQLAASAEEDPPRTPIGFYVSDAEKSKEEEDEDEV
jgi:hypothetical protein